MIRILLFVCSALLFLTGGWIRIRTWGSRLLFAHSFFGRFYWCYLILWALALVFLAGGIHMGKKKVKKEDLKETVQEKVTTETKTEILCPNCGTRLKPEAVFCQNCGCRVKEQEQKESGTPGSGNL